MICVCVQDAAARWLWLSLQSWHLLQDPLSRWPVKATPVFITMIDDDLSVLVPAETWTGSQASYIRSINSRIRNSLSIQWQWKQLWLLFDHQWSSEWRCSSLLLSERPWSKMEQLCSHSDLEPYKNLPQSEAETWAVTAGREWDTDQWTQRLTVTSPSTTYTITHFQT